MENKCCKIFVILSLILFFTIPAVCSEKPPDFPKKPIRLIVPYVPASGNDTQSRGIAVYLEKHLRVRVLIENRPGADGRIGVNEAWKSSPDGYTLINPGMPTPILNEKLFPVKYKVQEFTHIFAWSKDNIVVVVNSETWKTPQEFIADAQSKTLSGGVTGIGSSAMVAGLALEDTARFKPVNWVPFSGGGETMTQLAGKHIDFGITTMASAAPLVGAGKLRPLLVFSNEKDHRFPNTPLPREVGLNLTPIAVVWGVFAPPGLPQQIANILEQAFFKAVQEPDFLTWAEKLRMEISLMNRDQFFAYTISMEKEIVKHLDKLKRKINQ